MTNTKDSLVLCIGGPWDGQFTHSKGPVMEVPCWPTNLQEILHTNEHDAKYEERLFETALYRLETFRSRLGSIGSVHFRDHVVYVCQDDLKFDVIEHLILGYKQCNSKK